MKPIDVDDDIPLPPEEHTHARYPLHKLDVGQSFLVPIEERGAARAATSAYARKSGASFVTRATPEGLRIWRKS